MALPAVIFAALVFIGGCKRSGQFDQRYYENFLASTIARTLELAQEISETQLVLTNLLILTNHVKIEFLADYETKLLRYGKNAGFTNSLLEKYMILPAGIKGPPPDGGQIVLIGSKPLSSKNKKMERIFVARYDKLGNRFGADWIEEEPFQQALHEAQIRISDLPPSPPMPSMRQLYDPDGKIAANEKQMKEDNDKAFAEFQREHPVPLTQHPYFPYACFAALIVAIGFIFWWFHRNGSKPPH